MLGGSVGDFHNQAACWYAKLCVERGEGSAGRWEGGGGAAPRRGEEALTAAWVIVRVVQEGDHLALLVSAPTPHHPPTFCWTAMDDPTSTSSQGECRLSLEPRLQAS